MADPPSPAPRPRRPPTSLVLRVLPTVGVVGLVWALAWDTQGSFVAADWEPYALGVALLLAAVLLSGSAVRPPRATTGAALLLAAFAAWTAISIVWAPIPGSARDDALLAALYVVALVVPAVTLHSRTERLGATVAVVAGLASMAVATLVDLRFSANPADRFLFKRLVFPVSYTNAEAAFALVGVWPALALASVRRLPAAVRALALGGAVAMLSCFLLTQSKGGAIALAVSAVAVLAVSPARLRLLVPAVLAAGLTGAGGTPLTAPFRAGEARFEGAIRHAGTIGLVLAAAATAVGLAYALADRRLDVPGRATRLAGRAVAGLVVAAVLGGVAFFFVRVDHPLSYAQERWKSFQHLPTVETTSSHFTSLGSNRYDFWRVALDEFARHPLAGTGARGFGVAYLEHGHSEETPERAHSVEADALAETGIVGLLLLAGGGLLALVTVGRRARGSLLAAGLFGSGVYFAVHASGDWIWTLPAVGLPAFLLVGIGASPRTDLPLPGRAAVPAGVASAVLALAAFAPPWLAAKLVERAYDAPAATAAADDLRWAGRLDPLSVDPLLAEAALATPRAAVPPLRAAVAKQPRDAEMHYLLGLAYLDLDRRSEARAELAAAARLSPRDAAIGAALRRAERR